MDEECESLAKVQYGCQFANNRNSDRPWDLHGFKVNTGLAACPRSQRDWIHDCRCTTLRSSKYTASSRELVPVSVRE